MPFPEAVARRRTFAIISHPDAGKTTLTEKFLLYGGAVHLAGSVSAKKAQRQTTSDWMALEKQRGISISSTVLNFPFRDFQVNLLDTPGHQDFSEDTYRTLMAADSVIMLIDNAKGVETQTRKLFQVCRRRRLPVVTFINKLDRMGQDPLELLDGIEKEFGIRTTCFLWPIGMGVDFKGVYDRRNQAIHLFERTEHGAYKAPMKVSDLSDPELPKLLGDALTKQLIEELEILEMAGNPFDEAAYLAGELTPVFFGSAATNFGIELFLEQFLPMAPVPAPRSDLETGPLPPEGDGFSAFVFKIQANMDPSHRDCIAFLRICTGKFERDMTVTHAQSGKTVRLSHSHRLFGQDRETMEDGYAGDIIGISSGRGLFAIGDTVWADKAVRFEAVPTFPPELFARIYNPNPSKYKPFKKGIEQLSLEGAIQPITLFDGNQETMVLGAVGQLQFEVLQYRMESEYGVDIRLDRLPEYTHARWLQGTEAQLDNMKWIVNARRAEDARNRPMALMKGEWSLNYLMEQNPDIVFRDTPPA